MSKTPEANVESKTAPPAELVEDVMTAFRAFDLDGSGFYEEAELKALFKRLDPSFTDDKLGHLLQAIDRDGDGRISYEELFEHVFGAGSTRQPDTSEAPCQVGPADAADVHVHLRRAEIPKATKAKRAYCTRLFDFFNAFEPPPSVEPVGKAVPGDMPHLLLGVHTWSLGLFLMRIGALQRIQKNDTDHKKWINRTLCMPVGNIVRCVRRPEDDVREPPSWFAEAFASLETNMWLTGYEICDEIRALHKEHGLEHVSALEMLYSMNAPGVGAATHFLSHSQAENIMQTLLCMRFARIMTGAHPIFFVDYVCIRQCASGDFKPQAVQEIIGTIGSTVMALTPTLEPTALSRAWCVFEVACALQSGGAFMAAPYYAEGTKEKYRESYDLLSRALGGVNIALESCKSRDPKDKEMVLAIMEQTTGVATANILVAEAARSGIADALKYLKKFTR
eukprot:TRINITY_DN22650_c0_g1_i1.p1 TRINITY_DN22650_c0_g1~~TRINITY_DN22650_c0_g1_i1.p1  ORF type:complete len:450 (+),score=73.15 TRINITY_DN22650_c0_g1_i1:95-1444(+)